MKTIVTNAFSLNMVSVPCLSILVERVDVEDVQELLAEVEWESAVGHADTATVFSDILSAEIPFNRTSVSLAEGSTVIVGQYKGPRLPEGAKALPEGATIEWYLVTC